MVARPSVIFALAIAGLLAARPLAAQSDSLARKAPPPPPPTIVLDIPAPNVALGGPKPCQWGEVTYNRVRDVWTVSLDSIRLGATDIMMELTVTRSGVVPQSTPTTATATLSYLGSGATLRFIDKLGMHLLVDGKDRSSIRVSSPVVSGIDRRTLRVAAADVSLADIARWGLAQRVEVEVDSETMEFTRDQLRSFAGFVEKAKSPPTAGTYYACAGAR